MRALPSVLLVARGDLECMDGAMDSGADSDRPGKLTGPGGKQAINSAPRHGFGGAIGRARDGNRGTVRRGT
jgi:hypothetical protein